MRNAPGPPRYSPMGFTHAPVRPVATLPAGDSGGVRSARRWPRRRRRQVAPRPLARGRNRPGGERPAGRCRPDGGATRRRSRDCRRDRVRGHEPPERRVDEPVAGHEQEPDAGRGDHRPLREHGPGHPAEEAADREHHRPRAAGRRPDAAEGLVRHPELDHGPHQDGTPRWGRTPPRTRPPPPRRPPRARPRPTPRRRRGSRRRP